MKKVLLLALAIIFTGLSSCKDDEYKAYKGTWSGTYSGGDSGKWTVNIDDDGGITGVARPDSLSNFTFDVTGSVSTSGELTAQVNIIISTLDFTGTLSGNSANGVWKNQGQNIEGTWTGTRQ